MQTQISFKLCLALGAAGLFGIIVQSRISPNRLVDFTCNVVSFTRQTGNTQESYRGSHVISCIDISTIVPTKLSLNNDGIDNGCLYEVIGYSNSSCRDQKAVKRLNLSSIQPRVEINQRVTISSYRLQNNSVSGHPITVKFGGGNFNHEETHVLSQAGCYNLFGTGTGENYPRWVAVYDDRGSIVKHEDNYIELFSTGDCQDGRIIRYKNGATAIQYDQGLDKLTRNSSEVVIKSFVIIKINDPMMT